MALEDILKSSRILRYSKVPQDKSKKSVLYSTTAAASDVSVMSRAHDIDT